ncbi:MAG: carboxypeptidase-like regulatory domain-containing protein [Bacteroidetes bacterium]|nr:MAG: carboxypeptidase-like regulatory domain-containing protein [Bacteroidota bacterium]
MLRSFMPVIISVFFVSAFSQDITVKGTVYDKDSITPMQFAYVINKNSSTGMVANEKGNFTIRIHLGDTLAFSYVGYYVTKVFTHLLKDSVKNAVLNVKAGLKPKARELNPVIIIPHTFSKEQKETYQRKIDEYHRGIASPLASPISALYYTFSKRGKELQKLSFLYDRLLIEEIKESRLSAERIRSITGDDTLNVQLFLNYCFLPDQFVVSASDYTLFLSVSKYYKQYMEDRRKK